MKADFRRSLRTGVQRALVAAGFAAVAASASALPTFTFNPSAAGLAGSGPITADNIVISDFAKATVSGTSFTETGFLSIASFQSGGVTLSTPGLNSSYGLYIEYTGSGTSSGTLPTTSAEFTSLDYTLYGYNGTATFGFSGTTPTTTAASPIKLASGSLVSGSAGTYPGGSSFNTYAGATVTFDTELAAFFASPVPFFTTAVSTFTNPYTTVTPIAGGFLVTNGGGSFNFVASPVPEPETYGLMLAGLAAMGFAARRRRGS